MPGEEKKPTKKRTTSGTKKTSNVKSASGTSADKKTSTKKTKTTQTSKLKSTTIKDMPLEEKKEKRFIDDAADQIDAGTKIIKEKTSEFVSDFSGKASKLTDTILKKVKKGVSDAYEASSKAIDELTETAQDYAEKYKHKIEINKLKVKQDQQYSKLGSLIFDKYKVVGIPADKLFQEPDIKNIIIEIEKTAKEIVDLGKALDESDIK